MRDENAGYQAYARYQTFADKARETYIALEPVVGWSAASVWADITVACVRCSLYERRAFPETSNNVSK